MFDLTFTIARLPPRAAFVLPAVFKYEFEDPVLKRSIRHAYDVIGMPLLG